MPVGLHTIYSISGGCESFVFELVTVGLWVGKHREGGRGREKRERRRRKGEGGFVKVF